MRDVSNDEITRIKFYTNSRLEIVLKLYHEMFLKAPLNNQHKQKQEIEISHNYKKEAVRRAEKEGSGLFTILGIKPNELNNEKELNKKLKNLIRDNHPDRKNKDQLDEQEIENCDKRYKAAIQMKDFLNNKVLSLYLNKYNEFQEKKHNLNPKITYDNNRNPNTPEPQESPKMLLNNIGLKKENQGVEERSSGKDGLTNNNLSKTDEKSVFLSGEDNSNKSHPVFWDNSNKNSPKRQVEVNQNQSKIEAKAVQDLIALCNKYMAHLDKQKNRTEGSSQIKLNLVNQMKMCLKNDEIDTKKIENFRKFLTEKNRIALGVKRDNDWIRFCAAVGRILACVTVVLIPLTAKMGSLRFFNTHGENFFDNAKDIVSKSGINFK